MDCHYLNAFAAASTAALRQGFHSAGAEDNAILIFSELMDSQSLFLTANADTVYYVGIVDLTNGPMVVQTPPMALGTFDVTKAFIGYWTGGVSRD